MLLLRPSRISASKLLVLCSLLFAHAIRAEVPLPAPSDTAVASQPSHDTKPARRVAITAEIAYCLDMDPTDPRRSQCLIAAAETLAAGLRYQACLWNRAPPGACASPGNPPTDPAGADALLRDGQALVSEIEQLAAVPTDLGRLRQRVDKLQADAARLIRNERGKYSLVSQGGVSLGSWQAGYVYYLTEVLKLKGRRSGGAPEPAFKTVTGASAGAINALAAGIESCHDDSTDPEKSLFYQVWVDTLGLFRAGARGLFPSEEADPGDAARDGSDGQNRELGLFDTAPLREAMHHAEERLRYVSRPGCAFNYGFSVTHLRNVKEPIALDRGRPTIQASKLTEYFALRVAPQRGAEPIVTNLPAPQGSKALAARLGKNGAVSSLLLLNAVRASGAFPVAFPPVRLAYQYFDAAKSRWTPAEADFVDGGTLDNTPISLAATINDWTREAPPNPWLADLASPETYFFVNPGVVSWTTKNKPRTQPKEEEKPNLLGTYLGFAKEFVATGSDAQLVNAARQLDFLGASSRGAAQPRLEVPKRSLPIAGAEFGHFMAFLEKDFRRFDFYVGMHDAAMHLAEVDGLQDVNGKVSERLTRPTDGRAGVPELACLRAHHEAVQGKELAEIEKKHLPAECSGVPENFRAMLVGMHNYQRWMTTAYAEEEALDQFFDVLARAKFEFSDVKALASPALFTSNPRLAFRRLIAQVIDRLAGKQDGILATFAIKTGGRLAADANLIRAFPRHVLGVGYALNGFEVTGAVTLAAASWGAARLTGRVRLSRMGYRYVDAKEDDWTAVPSGFAGLTGVWGVPWLAPPGVLDLELSAGAAYSMLVLPWSPRGAIALHSFGPSVGLDIVGLQRLYVHLDWEGVLSPAFTYWGAQYDGSLLQQHQSKRRMSGSIGWRFLFD